MKFADVCLQVVKPKCRFLLQDDSCDVDNEEDDVDDDSILGNLDTVLVRGIPPGTSQDVLRLFLESRRSGGGDIAEMQLDEKQKSALVTFDDVEGEISHVVFQ